MIYLKFKVAISIIMIYFRLVRWCEKVTAFYDVEEIPLPALASPEALDDCGGVFAWVAAAVEVAVIFIIFHRKQT